MKKQKLDGDVTEAHVAGIDPEQNDTKINTILKRKSPTRQNKHPHKLERDFFSVDAKTLAVNLLGKYLVRQLDDGTILKGLIVETEAYPGGDDKASHSYNNRRTERCEPMYMTAGTTYVYFTYGMYHCFNISSLEPGGAVLLRALEPTEGVQRMKQLRYKNKPIPDKFKQFHLCNGPAKLCLSLSIDRSCNKMDMCSGNSAMWIENCESRNDNKIIRTTRVGIASSGDEAVKQPYRFYILGNTSVSQRDKIQEQLIEN